VAAVRGRCLHSVAVSVRPEFGPSLPALLRPRLAALPRLWRGVAIAGLGVVALVVLLLLVALRPGGGGLKLHDALIGGPVPFTLGYQGSLHQVKPPPAGTRLVLEGRAGAPLQRFTVTPLTLKPYRGDVSAAYLAASAPIITAMQASDPDFVYRGEGRARINDLGAYQISFQTKRDGHTVLGRRYLVVPNPPEGGGPLPTRGAEIELLAQLSPVVPNVDAVGTNGALKSPLRSFRFGTARP
jgi:hypothetical protein